MKKLFLVLAVAGFMCLGTANTYAQDFEETAPEQTAVTQTAPTEDASATAVAETMENEPFHKTIKQKFIEGGVGWMTPVLLCLIIGLAVAIERIIYLNLSTVNTKKLIENVEEALRTGGIEAAKDVCRNTRGPVASIFYQGLDRYDEGLDVVEKSVVSYGSVQMGQMESGLTWISLFIAVSPMLGFMGTVVGMIDAFDAIQMAGDINPTMVAGGIKVALLTTLAGLIAAVILQLFYNYIVSKIDGLVITMEDSSITLIDILTEYSKK
ncbi:MotA/TolQ/ExbB proton channel family protein [Alistipes sp. OttesenSCG-928-B03]|nr:MotA/TolQ/ExbB proton channel family protein [Alistipes sp. OttesenSCG-928-B03]